MNVDPPKVYIWIEAPDDLAHIVSFNSRHKFSLAVPGATGHVHSLEGMQATINYVYVVRNSIYYYHVFFYLIPMLM